MGKSNLFHFETPRPFAKIIGIGDGTESVLNDIKSEYGKNINAIKYEKDNYNISSTEERLTIIIIDEINVNLSEMLNAIPNTSELFLIMSPCEITLQDMLMECWSPISLKLLMGLHIALTVDSQSIPRHRLDRQCSNQTNPR